MFYQENISKNISSKRVLVLGDFMLDTYTMGSVERISPEAPVPVLQVKSEHSLPGGAGNAIVNLASLGMQVCAVGRLGDDLAGQTFIDAISKEGIDTSGIFFEDGYITPRKNRVMADSQQIVRVDYENRTPLSLKIEQKAIDALPKLLVGIDVIAISDYAKGFLSKRLLQAVIKNAKVPVIVDPKGMDFSRYRGATIIKPNLAEAIAAAGLGLEATLEDVAKILIEKTDIKTLIVTRASQGISIFSNNSVRSDYSATVHAVRDVTGAGDTVLALFTAAIANHMSLADAAYLSNIAASIAIERVGCARVTLKDIQERLNSVEQLV